MCNTPVIDYTTQGVLRGDTTVTAAMSKLEAKGIDVRVRVLTAAPGGSLDSYQQTMIAGCPSWSLNGAIKPNLLVILVSLDHQDAIFYGSNLSRLQKQVDQIRADMGSSFQAGNFPAGITKGEAEAYSTLYPSGLPAWALALIVLGIACVVGVVMAAIRGGGYGGGYGGSTTVIYGGGGGFSGGGGGGFSGGSGGSSGSW